MTQKPSIGVRLPQEYIDKIDQLCELTGKNRTDIMTEAIAAYLGEELPETIQAELEHLRWRVELLERKANGSLSPLQDDELLAEIRDRVLAQLKVGRQSVVAKAVELFIDELDAYSVIQSKTQLKQAKKSINYR